MSNIYDELYQRTYYGEFDRSYPRFKLQFDWVCSHCAGSATVLDFSCGRGGLLKMFLDAGYDASGTEASEHVIGTMDESLRRHVSHAADRDMGSWPVQYDVVIASDVVEHMESHYAAVDLLRNLARLSKRWLVVSVGINESHSADYLPGTGACLHPLSKDTNFWATFFREVADVKDSYVAWPSYYLFGEVHGKR